MPRDESAVSAVVGAVLLLALFSSAMTVWTISTLPEWKADKEQNHQGIVRQELGSLKADLEALAARRDPGPVTATIPLEVAKVPLLQTTAAKGTLGATSTGFEVDFAFTSPSVFFSDGLSVAVPSQAIGASTTPCTGPTVPCIQALEALEVGLVTSNILHAGDSASVTLTITDSGTNPVTVTATLTHSYVNAGCTTEVRLVVGTTTHFVAPCAGSSLGATSPYRVNVLDDRYTLASSIARLTEPYSLVLSATTTDAGGGPSPASLSATYAAALQSPAGLQRLVGSGVATAVPVADFQSGRIVYGPRYQSFPSQDLVLEGGALLVSAGGTRQAMAADPSLALTVDGTQGSMSWTLVQFTGAGSAVGARDATVEVRFLALQDVVLQATQATFTLTTETAKGWANFLDLATQAANAGASATVAHDALAETTTFTLTSSSGPVTSPWVIHLRIIQAEVQVR